MAVARTARKSGPGDLSKDDVKHLTPAEIRAHVRSGRYTGDMCNGVGAGHALTAVVGVPRAQALDFMIFAQRNAAACPVLAVTEPGSPFPHKMGKDIDLRTDLSKYRVFEKGVCVTEPQDATEYWRDDLVGFLIGVTESYEPTMMRAGVRLRSLEEGARGTVFVTNIDCEPVGALRGKLAVSFRPIHWTQVTKVVQLTSRFPAFHGAPIHIGNPKAIGIDDLAKPWFGEVVDVKDDEVPLFWACSVTPQVLAVAAKFDYMVTNAPACFLVCDATTESMAISS